MSARTAVVSAALLTLSGAALSQTQPKPPTTIPSPNVPTAPAWKPEPPSPPVAPREKTVDELLAELEDVQAQKARLDKQEAELKAAIRKKLDAQAERLKKLGVAPEPDKVGRVIVEGSDRGGDRVILKPGEPDRVGKIIIEGNTKTPNEKILKLVELQPGQVLQYPALEAARERLKKAGFRDVVVEVIANEQYSAFTDIRVKVTEADKR